MEHHLLAQNIIQYNYYHAQYAFTKKERLFHHFYQQNNAKIVYQKCNPSGKNKADNFRYKPMKRSEWCFKYKYLICEVAKHLYNHQRNSIRYFIINSAPYHQLSQSNIQDCTEYAPKYVAI